MSNSKAIEYKNRGGESIALRRNEILSLVFRFDSKSAFTFSLFTTHYSLLTQSGKN